MPLTRATRAPRTTRPRSPSTRRDIARSLDLAPELVAKIQLAGLLHDIGKIGVPQEVLMKPGALADEEWEIIREHPVVGERITRESPFFAEIADIIRHHHERHDGTGYPDGLVGGDIPVAAAIIGLADAYNAMTSPRPYRDALPPARAIAELDRCAGSAVRAVPRREVRARARDPRRRLPGRPRRRVLVRRPP